MIPYDAIPHAYLKQIRAEFNSNGVNLPDQWSDEGKYEGLFYTAPDKLFKEMEEK
jgi:hypothetical protein